MLIAAAVALLVILAGLLVYTGSGETNLFHFKRGGDNPNNEESRATEVQIKSGVVGGCAVESTEGLTDEVLGGGMGGVTE